MKSFILSLSLLFGLAVFAAPALAGDFGSGYGYGGSGYGHGPALKPAYGYSDCGYATPAYSRHAYRAPVRGPYARHAYRAPVRAPYARHAHGPKARYGYAKPYSYGYGGGVGINTPRFSLSVGW